METSEAVSPALNQTTIALSTESPAPGNESSTAFATGTFASETSLPINETTISGTEVTTEPTGAMNNESSIQTTMIVLPINESTSAAPIELSSGSTAVSEGNVSVSQPVETTMILLSTSTELSTPESIVNASTELSTPESVLNASTVIAAETTAVILNVTGELPIVGSLNFTEIISTSASSNLTELVSSGAETTTPSGPAVTSESGPEINATTELISTMSNMPPADLGTASTPVPTLAP
jgi:hypothetical protein